MIKYESKLSQCNESWRDTCVLREQEKTKDARIGEGGRKIIWVDKYCVGVTSCSL